jgi:hypothetical protein
MKRSSETMNSNPGGLNNQPDAEACSQSKVQVFEARFYVI